jgi:hypothetical protein
VPGATPILTASLSPSEILVKPNVCDTDHFCSLVPASMASSVDAKLLRQTKFPPEFNQKVDMKKVNVEVMKK